MAGFMDEPTLDDTVKAPTPDVTVSPYFNVTCETEGVNYKYSTDGSEPSSVIESLNNFGHFQIVSGSPMTIRIRAYKDGMEPSDIATCTYTPVTVPMALPDGSVLFYDRGARYGEYCIGEDGYPVRLSSGEDDGSAESAYWRYLICDKSMIGRAAWGPYNTNENMPSAEYEGVGYGLPNTDSMIDKYGEGSYYPWPLIKNKRDSANGIKWFLPSKEELVIVAQNKNIITSQGGDYFNTDLNYWSSSEDDPTAAWGINFDFATSGSKSKKIVHYIAVSSDAYEASEILETKKKCSSI